MILLKEGPIDQHMLHYKFTKKQMPEWIPRCDLKINIYKISETMLIFKANRGNISISKRRFSIHILTNGITGNRITILPEYVYITHQKEYLTSTRT